MTEAEWLACEDPTRMLEFLRVRASHRKLRLFAVACCHRIWSLLNERQRTYVDLAERFIEGEEGEKGLVHTSGYRDPLAVFGREWVSYIE